MEVTLNSIRSNPFELLSIEYIFNPQPIPLQFALVSCDDDYLGDVKAICAKPAGDRESAYYNFLKGYAQNCGNNAKQCCKPEDQAWCDAILRAFLPSLSAISTETRMQLRDCSNNADKLNKNLVIRCNSLFNKIKKGPNESA